MLQNCTLKTKILFFLQVRSVLKKKPFYEWIIGFRFDETYDIDILTAHVQTIRAFTLVR